MHFLGIVSTPDLATMIALGTEGGCRHPEH
jgi:hypothetical protein